MDDFLPFKVVQMSSSSQDTCIPPNQLLVNSEVITNTPIHNGGTYKLPPSPYLQQCFESEQAHQQLRYQCEFTPTFQTPHCYGFPFQFLPNPDAQLENPRPASLGFEETMFCPPCPQTPVMQEKGKGLVDDIPQQVIDSVDDTAPYRLCREKEKTEAGRIVGQPQESPTVENTVNTSFVEVTSDHEPSKFPTVRLSKGTSEQQSQIYEKGPNEDQGIDLNKTPQQKPRRKKHRPKVIREGKPSRTPKSRTPKPVTPNPPNNTETPTGKRKYLRRTNSTPQDPTGKRKYVRKNNSTPQDTEKVANPEGRTNGTAGKSAKRCLNFDTDDCLPTNNNPRSKSTSASNTEVMSSQNQWKDVVKISVNPCSTNVQESEPQTMGQTPPAGIAFDLNHSANSTAGEYVSFSEEPTRNQPLTANKMIIDQMPNVSQGIKTPPQQPRRRVLIRDNLKEMEKEESKRSDSILDGSLSDVVMMGTKRCQNAVEDSPASTYTNLIFNEMSKVSRFHANRTFDLGPTEYLKKRKTGEYIEDRPSPSSSVISAPETKTPQRSWNAYGMPSNMSTGLTLADAERIRAQQRMQALETMLALEQGNWPAYDKLHCTGNPYRESLTNNTLQSAPGQTSSYKGRKESEIQGATSCNASFIKTTQETSMANLQGMVAQKQLGDAGMQHPLEAGFSTYQVTSLGYKSHQAAVNKRRKSSKKSDSQTNTQRHQNGCSTQGNPGAGHVVQTMAMYGDFIQDIILKLKHLDINNKYKQVQSHTQNALVLYNGAQAMVPYKAPSNLTKKRHPRVKVYLDDETHREWKLLMGKDTADGDNSIHKDKEKYWEDEREVFRGRSESFIARMHLVQGDRRFSPWKGSVVDSVVGVFLTQNVSDHLSSSAFMALAAKFPLRSKRSNHQNNAEKMNASATESEGHILLSDDGIRYKEKASTQESSDGSSTVTDEVQNIAREEVRESQSFACSQSSIEDRGQLNGDESPECRNLVTSDTRLETVSNMTIHATYIQASNIRSMEDPISSQNSVVSSQNSSVYTLHTSSEATITTPRIGGETATSLLHRMESCNTFTELLEIANGRTSPNYSGLIDQWGCEDGEERTSALFDLGNPNSSIASLSMANSLGTQDLMGQPFFHTPTYHLHDASNSRILQTQNTEVRETRVKSHASNSHEGKTKTTENSTRDTDEMRTSASRNVPVLDTRAPMSENYVNPSYSSFTERIGLFDESPSTASAKPVRGSTPHRAFQTCEEHRVNFQKNERKDAPVAKGQYMDEFEVRVSSNEVYQIAPKSQKHRDETSKVMEPTVKTRAIQETLQFHSETAKAYTKERKGRAETRKLATVDWDSLRKDACMNHNKKERSSNAMDSVDWEAVRQADVKEISDAIRERGMNNLLAERVKDFLNRLVKDHGSIDLEWLRHVPPDKAKDYLLSVRGLGLKSVECVRLLTLHHKAFPVDTNVGRICVRLGWVPLQPLPESLQLHLLEMYPVLETIQKYLWPRLCTLDQRTLYELHYQMITFGKVFCTKSKPNCNSCPMRGECKHFASAFASARLALPGPEEKTLVSSTFSAKSARDANQVPSPVSLPQIKGGTTPVERLIPHTCEPIIEEPATPEPESVETSQSAIDEAFYEDPDDIPTIKLNFEAFTQNIQSYMQSNSTEGENELLSTALVVLSPEAASIPAPKLKNVSRLRTEHQVYELPDTHPLLKGLDNREPDDPCSYLLAIWTPGETAQSIEPPKICCNYEETGAQCHETTCFSCNSKREAESQTVRGTLLIPCRTAMRGSFPLNGTYFQVNEVFADHETSYNPINVPRSCIWNLPRRTVYFGTSVPTIFKGLSTEGIQHCFWRGFVCVRGFDRTVRAPRPLYARLHFPASKLIRNKKTAAHQD